jgi:hypothetical protein
VSGFEEWENGIVENWNVGSLENPPFQPSIIPIPKVSNLKAEA